MYWFRFMGRPSFGAPGTIKRTAESYSVTPPQAHRDPCARPNWRVAKGEHFIDGLVDGKFVVTQHGVIMSDTDVAKARRSTRVFMRVRVVVAGKNSDGRCFREACETIGING